MGKKNLRFRLGILGGGQLARMLALKAPPLGVVPTILSDHADDPAAQVTSSWSQGSIHKSQNLERFLKHVDVATFESEFLDADLLQKLSRKTGTKIYPAPHIMGVIQDRALQKSLLEKYKLPTAPSLAVATTHEAEKVFEVLGAPMILKATRFGYDGYGTFKVKTTADIRDVFKKNPETKFVAEKFIPFEHELAAIFVRDRFGTIVDLPLVETHQENARCLWVRGPVNYPTWPKLNLRIKKFLKSIDYVGAIGFEFFAYENQLLINELAPRVHNSGHYSQDALEFDQFTLHVMAVSGLPLPKENTPHAYAFAMYNLLGRSLTPKLMKTATREKVHLHWYGKSEVRPGRKMGHLNALGNTPDQALLQLKRVVSTSYRRGSK